ncbi:MAG: hypothetical protein QM755_02860 [Luteolibacter sp.]
MAAFWTIQGEAGKSMDATVRDLDAVGAVGAKVSFRALDVDTLTYSVPLAGLAPGAEILPENGQKVTLYRNGVRFFQGIAQRSIAMQTVSVTVYGAWWWLDRLTMVTGQTDSAGTNSGRVSFAFPQQSLQTSFAAAVSRAIALGAPITSGSYATLFPCPQITLNQSTCAGVLSELARLTPDVMPWFDYSTTSATINTARRSTATVRTLAVGAAPVLGWSVNPQIELKAAFVRTPYVKRDASGKRIWGEQLSGSNGNAQGGSSTTVRLKSAASSIDDAYNGCSVTMNSGAVSGQTRTITAYVGSTRTATVSPAWSGGSPASGNSYVVGSGDPPSNAESHVLTVSGEELDFNLPNDTLESYSIQTTAPTTNPLLAAWIMARDSNIVQARANYGGLPADGTLKLNTSYNYATTSAATSTSYSVTPVATAIVDANTLKPVSLTNKYLLVTEDPPEWAFKKSGITWTKVKISGELSYEFKEYDYGGANYGTITASYSLPSWWSAVSFYQKGGSLSGGFRLHGKYALFWHQFEVEGWAVSASYPAATTIYQDADYGFVSPPPGFAAGLQESQGFVPYVGTITLAEQEAGSTRYRGCVVNLTGSLPELATMKALVQSEELDLSTGRTTLTLGAPARLSYADFVSRVRRTSQDNIVYL